jgi:predicted nicotinamide N-methyase
VTHPGGAPTAFIEKFTTVSHAPLVPEITLQLATEITPIWQASEVFLAENNIEPPFWAFAWPGGQALARHILDHPERVRGKRVLDFACGGGIAAIACAMSGAASVLGADIDGLAAAAALANAALNRVEIGMASQDLVGTPGRWDLILCGDVCYEAPMTAHIMPWLSALAAAAEVWVADPGRAYLPQEGLNEFAAYTVPTSLELEDRTERRVKLFRLSPPPPLKEPEDRPAWQA